MRSIWEGFFDELEKIGAAIKSNDRMAHPTKSNVSEMMKKIESMDPKHRQKAIDFANKMGSPQLFTLLHSMRRWYSGQTMARRILSHRDSLSEVMRLDPADAKGVYRGFKVPKDDQLATLKVGDKITLPVTRNHGFSSWSTSLAATHKFSGGGKGKVGIIIKLIDTKGVKPVLAPPEHTEQWFNSLYEAAIGKSFRPKEGEYLIAAPKIRAQVVAVKK